MFSHDQKLHVCVKHGGGSAMIWACFAVSLPGDDLPSLMVLKLMEMKLFIMQKVNNSKHISFYQK